MATHKISVTVDEKAIRCEPDELRMTTKDEVSWVATNRRPFSIVFEGNSPLSATQLPFASATTSQKPTAKGYFKYAVVSEENPKLKLDPVIIVEEPPTGG
jgi:hypothetical protein